MKKLTLLSATLSFSCLTTITYAADSTYRAELATNYEQSNIVDEALDSSAYGIMGAYYFSDVNTANHPLAEAAFIERSSNVYASWSRRDYDDLNTTFDNSTLGVDFYVPDTMLFLGAGMAQINVDDNFGADNDSFWFAKLGVAPADGLLIWAQVREKLDSTDYWDINAKYVVPLSGDNAINLEATYADFDDGDSRITVAADYYFTRRFSLGAGYSVEDISGFDKEDIYELRARLFFSDKFSMQSVYTTGEYEDSLLIGARLRF